MTRQELITIIADRTFATKADVHKTLDAFLETVMTELAAANKITIRGFGTFSTCARKEKKGRNPRTGETIQIPGCRVVRFAPGNRLKRRIL